jgi:hypothetical protein
MNAFDPHKLTNEEHIEMFGEPLPHKKKKKQEKNDEKSKLLELIDSLSEEDREYLVSLVRQESVVG